MNHQNQLSRIFKKVVDFYFFIEIINTTLKIKPKKLLIKNLKNYEYIFNINKSSHSCQIT